MAPMGGYKLIVPRCTIPAGPVVKGSQTSKIDLHARRDRRMDDLTQVCKYKMPISQRIWLDTGHMYVI
jgi:hypothetical protein